MKECLIIGGNGFIGRYLIKGLLRRNVKVKVLDLSNDNIKEEDNIEVFLGDASDEKLLTKSLNGTDVVFFLLSTTNVITSVSNFEENLRNITYLRNCLNVMIKQNVRKIAFASSGGTIYGEPLYLPMDEDHPTNPVSPYGIIKLAMEKYLLYYKKKHNISPLILRYSNPFGHFDKDRLVGAVDIFYNKILNNKTIEIYGNPSDILRDYIDIEDLVEITLDLSHVEIPKHHVFNVGSGISISLSDIINYFEKILRKKADIKLKPLKNENVSKVVLNVERLNTELRLMQKTSIEELLDKKYNKV